LRLPPMDRGIFHLLALTLLAPGSLVVRAAAVEPVIEVTAIEQTTVADLVILSRGYNAGLRQGMVCRVTRGQSEVAEVILVDLRPDCSAALILSMAANQSIRAQDVAAIKVFKS